MRIKSKLIGISSKSLASFAGTDFCKSLLSIALGFSRFRRTSAAKKKALR
jgi:hypothetical protein